MTRKETMKEFIKDIIHTILQFTILSGIIASWKLLHKWTIKDNKKGVSIEKLIKEGYNDRKKDQ